MRIIKKKLADLKQEEISNIEMFLNNNYSTIFHEPCFNEIIEEAFGTIFFYILVYNNQRELIALCPIHFKKNKLLKIAYSNPTIFEVPYGGWVYNQNEISLRELLNQLKLSINEMLIYTTYPLLFENNNFDIKDAVKFQTAVIDLKMSEDFIWNNYINQKRRNMIRKAQKNSLKVEKYDYSGFQYYYELMKETYQHVGLEIKPKIYYEKILKSYAPSNKAVVLLAKKDSELLSGCILLRNKYMCHYWLSARKREAKNYGQGELLQWENIRWARLNGTKFYDLCVIEPERLPNIARFKLGFSENIIPFYHFIKKRLSYRILSKIQKCL